MRPAFVLEDRVGAVAADLHGDLPIAADLGRAGRQGTVLEAEAVGVAGVAIRARRRRAACRRRRPGPDLDDDVLVVVRVAVDELGPDALGEVFDPLLGIPRFGREKLPLLRVLGLGMSSRASRSASIASSSSLESSAPRRMRACSLATPA